MSCDTTTRSVPLIMKVPLSVINGKSPRKMSFLIGLGTSLPSSSTWTYKGAANVISRSTHSSMSYLGLSNQYFKLKPGSTRLLGNHSCMPPLKDSIGETSSNSSARPSFRNQWNDS